ncbi:MAG: cytidine deaminase [Coprobacillus sp.]|nr:cytidine deaminase [Coprobacillus sp.]
MTDEELIEKAKEAMSLSYSPYSGFKVGAALVTKEEKVYLGTNIENASYPLCMCAERNAIYNALCNGEKAEDILALAVIADSNEPCSPCGACRQVISELLDDNTPIILSNTKGDIKRTSPKELLPFSFSKEDLGK